MAGPALCSGGEGRPRWMPGNIRTKAALASSSLATGVKALDGEKASIAIADDEHMGAAAMVVVLDANGAVLQKKQPR